jgi:hypothetical protein
MCAFSLVLAVQTNLGLSAARREPPSLEPLPAIVTRVTLNYTPSRYSDPSRRLGE